MLVQLAILGSRVQFSTGEIGSDLHPHFLEVMGYVDTLDNGVDVQGAIIPSQHIPRGLKLYGAEYKRYASPTVTDTAREWKVCIDLTTVLE